MTHFAARFPQYSKPVSDPKPEDYLDAVLWYSARYMPEKAESFRQTYRRVKWSRKIGIFRIEAERAG